MKLPEPSAEDDRIGKMVVDAAYHVHKNLGPGLLESVYETCFCHELTRRGVRFERQAALPVNYDGLQLDAALRLDVLVEERIICEMKAAEKLSDLHMAQILTYLKLADLRLGYLINWNVKFIRSGIKRVVGGRTRPFR